MKNAIAMDVQVSQLVFHILLGPLFPSGGFCKAVLNFLGFAVRLSALSKKGREGGRKGGKGAHLVPG